MSKSEFSLEQLKTAIEEKEAKWHPELTTISQLTVEEQKTRLGLLPTKMELQLATEFKLDKPHEEKPAKKKANVNYGALAASLPSKQDWRDVNGVDWTTPIKDQYGCGSCVAFGTIAALDALLRIRTFNDPNEAIDLSEAHLLFCGGGSCNGWHMDAACNYLKSNGVPDEACFPYAKGLQVKTCATCSDWQNRIDHTKILSWTNTKDVNEMKKNLVENGPQITGMAVYQDFFSYAGGVYQYVTGSLAGYHCVAVVGYDDGAGCWICKNSWGTGWGEAFKGQRGWFRIKYGQCGMENVFGMWDMVVPIIKTSGYAKFLLVDHSFTSNVRYLWAYSEGAWKYKPITDAQVEGIVKVLMEAKQVYVWWDGDIIAMVRAMK